MKLLVGLRNDGVIHREGVRVALGGRRQPNKAWPASLLSDFLCDYAILCLNLVRKLIFLKEIKKALENSKVIPYIYFEITRKSFHDICRRT